MTYPPQLKLGFIGGSIYSAIGTTHKIASQMDGYFRLHAGSFSRDKEVNLQTAKTWRVNHVFDSYHAMFQKIQNQEITLDAVVILTPTDMHEEPILEALDQSIPVICEKTLTDSLASAQTISEKVKETKGFLVTTYNYTGYPMLRELRSMIQQNKLGKIIQIQAKMPQESFIRLDEHGHIPQPQAWRLEDKHISKLSLDLGTHLTNMIHFLTQESITEVVALGSSFGHHPVMDNIATLAKLTNDIDCHIWYTKSALGHTNGLSIEVYGTEGSVFWEQLNPEVLQYNDNRGRIISLDRASKGVTVAREERYNRFKSGHPAGFIEAFANYYEDIYHALLEFKDHGTFTSPYVFGMESSLEEIQVMHAIERSIQQKQWVTVTY